jgi:hypothetical protein
MAYQVQLRQEQLVFPQPPRQELALATAQPQNYAGDVAAPMPQNPAQARELAVNNAMLAQMLQLVYQMGQDAKGSDEEERRLALENKELRQHLIQRIEASEKEWIGTAEQYVAKVDAIYLKLNKLYKEFTAEEEEVNRVRDLELKSCMHVHWGRDFSMLGWWVCVGFICRGAKWEAIHCNLRDSLKTLVRAEAQQIKEEMVPDERIQGNAGGPQQIAVLSDKEADTIDAGAVFHAFTQKHQEETQTRDEGNAAIRKNNDSLTNKIKKVETSDRRLLAIVQKHLSPYLNLSGDIKIVIQEWSARGQWYNESLTWVNENLKSTYFREEAKSYKKGIELSGKIISTLNEILPLVESLQKEITL